MIIADLDAYYANEIYSIIQVYQNQSSNVAQINWNLKSICEVLQSNKAIGLIEGNEKTPQSKLLSFIIYKDMDEIVELLILASVFERQSQGLMGRLLTQLKSKFSEIWLEVHEENLRAIQFYNKEHFNLDGKRPKYYTDSKAALVMSWKRGIAF